MEESIAVIGAGIAGASVAYQLGSRTDAQVTVFERGAIGAETTGKSTAVFRFMDDPVLISMKRDAMALYNRLLADPVAHPEYDLLGRLEASTTEAGAAQLAERAKNIDTGTYLDATDLATEVFFPELDTDPLTGAVYNPNAGSFRPIELAHELVERARGLGVSFRTNTEVTDIEIEEGSVRAVHTPSKSQPVSHVVSTAGPWNLSVARSVGLELPIRHTLAPILKLEPTRPLPHVVPNIKHTDTGYYFLGRDDGSILVGHSPGTYAEAGTEYDPEDVRDEVPEELVSGAIDEMRTLFPSLLDAEVVEEWVGVRSLTPDGRPLVGPTTVEGFSIVAFNSEGIQLAPAAARVIAAQITGAEPPDYAASVSPSRDGKASSG
jgi:sarcosine oxidase subunit beta